MILLIGGYSRSGTTMLWKLFNRHPDIRLTYEFREFYALGKPFREYEREILDHMRYRGIYGNRVLGPPDTDNNAEMAATYFHLAKQSIVLYVLLI